MAVLAGACLLALGACDDHLPRSAGLDPSMASSLSMRSSHWNRTASGDYLAGRHAERMADFGQAAGFYGNILTTEADNRTLRRRVVLLLLSEGHVVDAVEHARRLEGDGTPGSIETTLLGVEDVRRGDFVAAERRFAALEPTRYDLFLRAAGIAWSRLGQGDTAGAIEAISALDAYPELATLRDLHHALLLDLAGDVAEAKRLYLDLASRHPSPSLRIVQLAGNFFARQGDTAQTEALYAAYREDHPRSTLAAAPQEGGGAVTPLVSDAARGLAEAFFNLAGALYEERDLAVAMVQVKLAMRLWPDSVMFSLLDGELLEASGRHADAIEAYRRIDPKGPAGRAAALRIAQSFDADDNIEAAVTTLRDLAATDAVDPEPLIALGDILRARERFEEAAVAYDEALARVGEPQPHHWRLLYSRGIARERSGRWEEAEQDLKKALEYEPDQAYVLNYLGYSWVDRGVNLDEAATLIRRAVELRPDDGFIADSLGWVYYRLGNFQSAVRELERAIALEPVDPVINEHLGDAYWMVGRRIEARFQWQRALRSNPEAERIEDIESKMACGLDGCPAPRKSGG